MRYIDRVGVEIEGGWDYQPMADIYVDFSVSINSDYKSGEIASPAYSSLREVVRWVKNNYPSRVNETCGLHIHVSLKNNLYYSKLMCRDFLRFFREIVEDWAASREITNPHFWNRLSGRNTYCLPHYNPDVQARLQEKKPARYTQINYCYSLRKTVECRLFPAFKDYKISCDAIKLFLYCVEAFLFENKGKEKAKVIAVPLNTQDKKEKNLICEVM